MARFSSPRRRALRRATVGLDGGRIRHSARLGWVRRVLALALTLSALVLLLRTGSSLRAFRLSPFSASAGNTASEDANSPAAIARDYYNAYQGTPAPSPQVAHIFEARFGSLAPRAVGAPGASTGGTGGITQGVSLSVRGRDTQFPRLAQGDVAPLPPFATLTGGQRPGSAAGTGDSFNLGDLPTRELLAQGEVAARDAAERRQLALLNRFLRVSQTSETAALQSDVTEAKRSLADAVRAAGQLDLGPLPIELPDAEIQLEMTNLRLKLLPGLRLKPGERERAEARLQQLEAEWNARLALQRDARGAEIEKLLNERPRAVDEEGARQLEAETRAAHTRNAQERQKIAAQLSATLRGDATQQPLRLTLPAVQAARVNAGRRSTNRQDTKPLPSKVKNGKLPASIPAQ